MSNTRFQLDLSSLYTLTFKNMSKIEIKLV